MDITKLERMIAVYEAGSFRKAAMKLGMSQPALTWSVRKLEESLDAVLFIRGPRGIQPTEICERLISRANLIVNEQTRMMVEVERSNKVQSIDVGVHPIMLNSEFAQSTASLRTEHPNISVRIIEGFSSRLLDMLKRGELDFAYCAFSEQAGSKDIFDFELLASPDYSVVARPDHPIFNDIKQNNSIKQYSWTIIDTPNIPKPEPDDQDLLSLLESVGFKESMPLVRSSSVSFLRSLILNAGMLGMVADTIVATELSTGKLKRVPGTTVSAPPIGLVTLSDSYESAAIRRFKSKIRQLHKKQGRARRQ